MCGARSSSARYRRYTSVASRVAAHGHVDVAEQLERASGRRVERGGFAKVAERGAQLAAAAIAVAPLEVRQHRVVLEGERAAEGLDGLVGLVAGERRVAGRDQAAEFALLSDGVPARTPRRPAEARRQRPQQTPRFMEQSKALVPGTLRDTLPGSKFTL